MDPTVDYQGSPDLDPNRDLTVDDVALFQRFRQEADLKRVDALLEEEIRRHLRLCEIAILSAASNGCHWCDLPEHPMTDVDVWVQRHLAEKGGFKIAHSSTAVDVVVPSDSDKTKHVAVTEVRHRTTASWGINVRSLDAERVKNEWKRRESLEAEARANYIPEMKSRVEGTQVVEQRAIWAAVLDGKYVVEVQRILHQNTLCIFDLAGHFLHGEATQVSYGAMFGPDICDVAAWEDRAAQIVDERTRSGSRLSE